MRRLGVPKVPELEDNATQTRIFEAGHIFHKFMQDLTKEAGISIAQEVELEDHDLMIRGHFDDLLLIENNLLLVDYKTAHSASFNYKKQRSEIGHYHRMQLGTYMYMLRQNKLLVPSISVNVTEDGVEQIDTTKLTEARILSISKDDLRMHEDQLLWDERLEKDVVTYWQTLNKWWADKKMPPCTCLEHDGGFMGKRSAKGKVYNDYFYNDQPCSLEWYRMWKANNRGDKNGRQQTQTA